MSGHNKWSKIKNKKGASDAQRGQLFTKLTREIMLAVRQGGTDPNSNRRLELALQKAKAGSMPWDNIQRAMEKGSGTAEGMQLVRLLVARLDADQQKNLVEGVGRGMDRLGEHGRGSGHPGDHKLDGGDEQVGAQGGQHDSGRSFVLLHEPPFYAIAGGLSNRDVCLNPLFSV